MARRTISHDPQRMPFCFVSVDEITKRCSYKETNLASQPHAIPLPAARSMCTQRHHRYTRQGIDDRTGPPSFRHRRIEYLLTWVLRSRDSRCSLPGRGRKDTEDTHWISRDKIIIDASPARFRRISRSKSGLEAATEYETESPCRGMRMGYSPGLFPPRSGRSDAGHRQRQKTIAFSR